MNLSDMYRLRKPFAVCIDTIEIGDDMTLDVFAIIPKHDPKEGAVKFAGYYSIRIQDLTASDKRWVKQNKENLKETHRCEFGRVYEPDYCDFRNTIRKKQLEI